MKKATPGPAFKGTGKMTPPNYRYPKQDSCNKQGSYYKGNMNKCLKDLMK